jgi:uncharacterized protein (DUF488 family)
LPITLFTLGHSNHPIERLASLLTASGATLLVDVRSSPYSRYHPQFNRETLAAALPRHGIAYEYAGDALGGRPADPTCYKAHQLPGEDADYLHEVDYPAVMQRPWFLAGIAHLLDLASAQTAAILCSEEDPAHCHRHHLIARHLLDAHPEVEVWHIRADGVVFRASALIASVDEPPSEQLTLF